MSFDDLAGLVLAGTLLLLILIFCIVVIKRYWIDKKAISFGSQFVGENIMRQFQNEQKKRAIEHVIYQREDEEKSDEAGEDKSRV